MAEAGDGGVGAAPGVENGDAAQPMVAHAAGRVRAAPGVAPLVQAVANVAPPVVAAPAAPVVGVAAVVLVAAPVAAMLAGPVILNPAAPVAAMLAGPVILNPAAPTFDVDAVLMGPLPRKSTMTLCEILPWVEDENP